MLPGPLTNWITTGPWCWPHQSPTNTAPAPDETAKTQAPMTAAVDTRVLLAPAPVFFAPTRAFFAPTRVLLVPIRCLPHGGTARPPSGPAMRTGSMRKYPHRLVLKPRERTEAGL